MRLAISGVTLTGNLGGVAMLQTIIQEVRRRFPDAELALLSISPARDRLAPCPAHLRVVPCHWLALICVFLPLSVLAAPFRRSRILQRLLGAFAYFRALFESHAVVDVSGIAFVDGRGPALLAYNLACCAPAFLLGRPVVKLAQTLGPFRERLNRNVARWALSRCAIVIARGAQSGRNLENLGFSPALVLPDVTFCLEVPAATRAAATAEIQRLGFAGPPVMLSPSRVLQRACRRRGIDLAAVFAGLIERLHAGGQRVALLAHSEAAGIAKNDDAAVCTEILGQLRAGLKPPVLTTVDPVHARALIGGASLFVGCRYHSLVSAYAMGVPAIALSWNHKYDDLAQLVEQTAWLVTAGGIGLEPLHARLQQLQEASPAIRTLLAERMPSVAAAAAENFRALERVLAPIE